MACKLNEALLKEFIKDRKAGKTIGQLCEKYKLGRRTVSKYISQGIAKGYMTKEENEKIAIENLRNAWRDVEKLRAGGKKGGLSLWYGEKHEKSRENSLRALENYRHGPNIKDVLFKSGDETLVFHSKLERYTGVFLELIGFKLEERKNFHVPLEIMVDEEKKKICIDFLIDNLAIEVHSYKGRRLDEDNNYEEIRGELTKTLGLELFVVKRESDHYNLLLKLKPEEAKNYYRLKRKAREMIKDYEESTKSLDEEDESNPFL